MYKDSLGKVYVEIIDAILQKEGFTRWSTERAENCVEYHYWDNFYGINLWVNPDTEEFRFEWAVPCTIFSIKCPKCSPITNAEHFTKMLFRFRECVKIMKEGLRNGTE